MPARQSVGLLPLILLAAACGGSQSPIGPPRTEVPQSATGVPPTTPLPLPTSSQCTASFPALAKPARIYAGTTCPSYSLHGGPLVSRYVLYDDGEFALQYSSATYAFFEYRGTYGGHAGRVSFAWDGWSIAGPWSSTGVLTEESLLVSYNDVMKMSDFEDGLYVRAK